ncbi:MAG: metal-dependent hydrolase [Acidobacteria bacterium]|nr:MAG: metal-dependent hydrolase [Acidobacteriota bacterium]
MDKKADLRFVVFLTLLADIIDKPFGLVIFSETINNGRVWFHSLAVNLALSAVLLLWRKPLVCVLALWFHQLCDGMWMRPWVALWPLTGALGYRDLPLDQWVYNLLSPYNVITELAGLALLVVFGWYYGLLRWERFKSFLATGKLEKRLV